MVLFVGTGYPEEGHRGVGPLSHPTTYTVLFWRTSAISGFGVELAGGLWSISHRNSRPQFVDVVFRCAAKWGFLVRCKKRRRDLIWVSAPSSTRTPPALGSGRDIFHRAVDMLI